MHPPFFVATYRDYVIDCRPIPLADAQYWPKVSVSPTVSYRGRQRRCIVAHPSAQHFATAAAAAEFSLAWGKRWVDEEPATLPEPTPRATASERRMAPTE
jgi:hypothetical protein